jgi:hypothetical protein
MKNAVLMFFSPPQRAEKLSGTEFHQGTSKKFLPWKFSARAARVTPAPHFMNQWLTPLIHAGAWRAVETFCTAGDRSTRRRANGRHR